ncbi:glycine zipper domain-containing protein [Mesorhizobium sp. BAC0120]|uniref:glycine zipper domain-containing protein n=1 Tax=Mesorhizobium sp. BAC0120 TaxID=3090670 RepID=UPI00298C9772|nr:glycine zipper domain-containing protein [Mesorhizobium sp. BAC0120]MDW6022042.1 glycine zipper domain-containing protein [Mesorhizobium sp. BAC0120]
MRKLIVMLAAVAGLAGCTNAERGAVIGGAGGAALGTLAGGNDVRNAIVGGAVGAVAGTLIGNSMDKQGYCRYRDQYGRIYEARCS